MKLHKSIVAVLVCLVALLLPIGGNAAKLEKTAPTSVGIEPKQFMLMYDSLMSSDLTEIHHVVVLVDGKIAGELHPKPFRV